MPYIVLDISLGQKDLTLSYVTISRVRRLSNIMFEQSFDLDRITTYLIANAII